MFPYVLIGIGCIIFVVSFLGCCGAITENTCMLFSVSGFFMIVERVFFHIDLQFSVLLMGVFVLQVGIGIYAFEKRDQLDGFVQSSLNDTLNSIKDHKEYLAPWDLIQNRVRIVETVFFLKLLLNLRAQSLVADFLWLIDSLPLKILCTLIKLVIQSKVFGFRTQIQPFPALQ